MQRTVHENTGAEHGLYTDHVAGTAGVLGWLPSRPDTTGRLISNPVNVCPSILISPGISDAKNVEEQRFDRYNHIQRSQEMGNWLNVTILFSVYEPGIRLPGFFDTDASRQNVDPDKIIEGTEEGLFTLFDWMDDFKDALLGAKTIPGTDMVLDERSLTYSPYCDSNYIVDKRPIFYGFIGAKFYGYAHENHNQMINKFL